MLTVIESSYHFPLQCPSPVYIFTRGLNRQAENVLLTQPYVYLVNVHLVCLVPL